MQTISTDGMQGGNAKLRDDRLTAKAENSAVKPGAVGKVPIGQITR